MSKNFYLLEGTLQVEASGYWYTRGGEKGSFGYYPHLKDRDGRPVYSDTQLHGDLHMAARWNAALDAALDAENENNAPSSTEKFIASLFGKRGHEIGALLQIGDLTLTKASREKWSPKRFDIKPRIEIDDDTRTVKKNMLANFEVAWLKGLTLQAPLYAGYFTDRKDAEKAQQLLNEALQLLTGFGAIRSRGNGRGKLGIHWQEISERTIAPSEGVSSAISYALESLVNFRSKPVAAEQLQLVATNFHITVEQIRGWVVSTYYQITDCWPTADEMASINFSDLFPSPSAQEPAFPPPNTTLRREDGASIDDYWGRPPTSERSESLNQNSQGEVSIPGQREKCKLKPLKPGTFMTREGKIHEAKAEIRMRNAMQEDFRTLDEGGLFVQQYLPQWTVFCGQITIADPSSEFGRLALAILTTLRPVINGCMLRPTIGEPPTQDPAGLKERLVITPEPFNPEAPLSNDAGITIGSVRRFAPALRRPRRNRPAILPGSVLTHESVTAINWPLFGENIATSEPGSTKIPPEKPDFAASLPKLDIKWKDVTRSQAGNLRELLNQDHNTEVIEKYLKNVRDKHVEKKSDSSLAKLYNHLEALNREGGLDLLREEIKQILDHLKADIWWYEKNSETDREEA